MTLRRGATVVAVLAIAALALRLAHAEPIDPGHVRVLDGDTVAVAGITPLCNYGRLCAELRSDGQNVAEIMVREGLAHPLLCGPTRCPRREPWCWRVSGQVPGTSDASAAEG